MFSGGKLGRFPCWIEVSIRRVFLSGLDQQPNGLGLSQFQRDTSLPGYLAAILDPLAEDQNLKHTQTNAEPSAQQIFRASVK